MRGQLTMIDCGLDYTNIKLNNKIISMGIESLERITYEYFKKVWFGGESA